MSYNYPPVIGVPGPQGPVGPQGPQGNQGPQGLAATKVNCTKTFTASDSKVITITDGLITGISGSSGWIDVSDNRYWEPVLTTTVTNGYSGATWNGTSWLDEYQGTLTGGRIYLAPKTTGSKANWHVGYRPTKCRFEGTGLGNDWCRLWHTTPNVIFGTNNSIITVASEFSFAAPSLDIYQFTFRSGNISGRISITKIEFFS
jgi:hypothetical protein